MSIRRSNRFVDTCEDPASLLLANSLKDETEEGTPERAGFYVGLAEVTWNEIATSWLDAMDADSGQADDEPVRPLPSPGGMSVTRTRQHGREGRVAWCGP